jgi:hypothetical protein
LAHAGERKRRRGCWASGWGGRWASGLAHSGRKGRRGEGPTVRKRGFGLLAAAAVLLSSSFSFPFLFYTQTFKQNYLNSIKFEFKSYKLNTNKTMLQHECTNILIL